MSVNWDCWIGDEAGTNQVALTGIYQPKPRPWPKPIQHGSDHVMLDGTLDPQRFSARKKITVRLVRTTAGKKDAIEALYYRFDDPEDGGQQKKVTVNNADKTYLCVWESAPDWEPASDRLPERWNVECNFLIISEVT